MDLTREQIEALKTYANAVGIPVGEATPEQIKAINEAATMFRRDGIIKDNVLSVLCTLALRGLKVQWRPTETAPRGERVILFCGSLNGEKEVIASNIGRDPAFPWHCDDNSRIAHDVPTHWLPLPAPPEGK